MAPGPRALRPCPYQGRAEARRAARRVEGLAWLALALAALSPLAYFATL